MKSFYKIILLLYGCYFSLAASGQNFNLVSPITISMPNNPVANTDDWGKGAQPFIITAKKNTPNELQSWMLVTIKKGGSKTCGSNTPQTAPEVYFDVPLKTWVGATAVSLLGNSCTLQPGEYELCVQFYLKDHRTIIGENCKSFTIKESKSESYAPPQNIMPAADKKITAQEAGQPLKFRWTPIVPKPKANVNYRLKVWQLMQGQSATAAIKGNTPVIEKDIENATQAIQNITDWKCGVPCEYVWKVEASKTSALGDIEMLGTSEATAFSVSSNETQSSCDCKSVQCTKKLWYKDVSTGIVKEFTCIKPTPIVLDCNKNYYFFADTKCSPNTNCKMIVKGEFRNAAGALVIQQTPFNSASSAFNIISGTPGNYTFTIKYYINDIECGGNCTIPIVVSCNPPVDCCKNGNWYNKNWYSGKPLVFNGVGALPVPLPASGTNLGTWPCAVPSYAFHCSFACANNCSGQINYSIYNAATGILISTQTIPNATYASLPAITTNGNYLLVIAAICGKDTCSNKLQYPFEIKCTPPVNCCQNATQKDPSVYDAAGANLATFSCTQPKAYYINAANKNCDKELIIKASANCGSAANCPSKITYTLLNTGTSSILTGTGVLTIPATLANGVYTLTVDYYCGNTICKSCKFEIKKDCPLVIDDCCKNSSWGEKIHYKSGGITGGAVPAPLPASGSNLGVVACGSNKQFKICYNCAQGCGTAQIKYDVYLAYSLVLVSSTTVASCSVANITMPATAGNYQIRITAICNGKECNAMDYFINTECRPVDCCKGSYWTSKSLDWDIKIKLLQTDATTTDNQAAQKTNAPNKKEKKTPAGKIPPVGDIGVGQANLTNGSIKINNCGDTIKINEGGQYTFNAGYTCNTTLANCKGKVIAKVKDPNGITYGTWPLPHLFNFATAGKYTVTYYAYCGETVCDSCIFYVNAAKDCCKGSDWIKAEYQIVNKKSNGEYDHSDKTYYALPLKITNPIPVLKADGAIDLEKLEFTCAAGCTAGFILKRKNITTGVEETPEIITAGGTPSVYAKPYPQLITIVPTCGGISCGKPIVFRLECLSKNCIPLCKSSSTLNFSTGLNDDGSIIGNLQQDPYWTGMVRVAGQYDAQGPPNQTWNNVSGAAIMVPNTGKIKEMGIFTTSRCFYVCENTQVNINGAYRCDNILKSFILRNSLGNIVWQIPSTTSTNTYQWDPDNPYSGIVNLVKGKYCFEFTYENQYSAGDAYNPPAPTYGGFAIRGMLTSNKPVLSNIEQECCPNSTTNTAISYGQVGQLNGLNLDMDTCSCNGGKWDFGFEINGALSGWPEFTHSPPLTFACNPSSYPLKLALIYVCNKNWNCSFNVKLIKKNLTTNVETVIVSENDIIPYSSYYNHSVLNNWLYPDNDICQYTIIPYCSGKECGDRLVFNIASKNAAKTQQEKDFSATCNACGKKFAITDLKVHQRICEKKPTKTVAGKNAGAGYSCDCCNGVYTAEQLIKHAKACCKKKEDLNAMSIDKKPKLMCKCCGKDFTSRSHNPECCLDKETGEPGVIINIGKGVLTNYYCKCCDKNIPFTGASAAAAHQKECCAKPVTTTTVTAGKMVNPNSNAYVCSICNEPISGGASGLAKHESEVHNMVTNSNGSKTSKAAPKGWDGKVQGKTVSIPYPCTCCGKSIEFTSGQSAVDHRASCCPPPPTAPTTKVGRAILNNCPPPCDWDTLAPGGPMFLQSIYVVADGKFNNKKELLSSKEISNELERKLQLGTGLVFKGAIVQKHKVTGLTVLVAYYTCCRPPIKGDKSGTDDRVEIITIPLKEEKGYLKMEGVAVKETIAAGKTTITRLPEVSSKKHDYVGHVILLR